MKIHYLLNGKLYQKSISLFQYNVLISKSPNQLISNIIENIHENDDSEKQMLNLYDFLFKLVEAGFFFLEDQNGLPSQNTQTLPLK